MPRWLKWLLAVPVAIAVAAYAGTFVYARIADRNAPDRLTLDATDAKPAPPTTGGAPGEGGIDGTWAITSGSRAGYRVEEVLFGQNSTAVGRTSDVRGTFVIEGAVVRTGEFTVDMTTVRSDQSRRDDQFNGRVMDVSQYPTSTFTLTEPIELGALPEDGQQVSASATGNLTLRGTTKTVTVELQARRNGATIEVASSIPITFADWGIPNPSFGGAQTEDHGEIELLLVFAKAGT